MDGTAPLGGMVDLVEESDESGNKVSPSLPPLIKNMLIDIDGTVGEDIPNEEAHRMATAEVFQDALATINRWHGEGHIITFFTARTEEHREVTEQWLESNGFQYHGLLMGKPRGGNYHWFDNHIVRATRFNSKFTDLIKRSIEIEVFDD